MNTRSIEQYRRPLWRRGVLACGALLLAGSGALALAQHGPERGHRERPAARYYDDRHEHDRYYPPRGAVFARPPLGSVVRYRDRRYWYGGGVWYAPRGPRFVVVAPPIGAFVTVLPDFYTTVWFGGFPYFYANEAYYVWRERRRAYEVVEPPSEAAASTTPPTDDLYIYPRNGQDAALQARDRYECHRWAVEQTGFDPTRPGGGVPETETAERRSQYFRAMTACLEGRGYTVR